MKEIKSYLIYLILFGVIIFNDDMVAQDQIEPPAYFKMKLVEKRMIMYRSLSGKTSYKYISEDGSEEYTQPASVAGLGENIQCGYTLLPDKKSWLLTTIKNVDGKPVMRFWKYDLASGKQVKELLSRNRPADNITIEYIARDGRYILCRTTTIRPAEVNNQSRRISEQLSRPLYIVDLRTDKWTKLSKGEDFIYGVKVNNKQTKIAYHNASEGYTINIIDMNGENLKRVVGNPGHIYFGPVWSPDGKWLAYHDCYAKKDLPHHFSDLCIARSNGSDHHVVTKDQSQYFGTTHGPKERRGGGSNWTEWTKDGKFLLYTKCSPGAHPDASFHAELGDHKELVFCPECATGGSSLLLLNPFSGKELPVTKFEEGRWDFEGSFSPDGKKLVYVTAMVGKRAEIHVCDINGRNDIFLTAGDDGLGADYPVWVESVLVEENSTSGQ
jgi:hypothetical protein